MNQMLKRINGPTRTISITSGKGGVGKTTVATNLAHELSLQGHRVLVFDADLGMANVDVMFGVRSNGHIGQVLEGDATLSEVMVEVNEKISIIPGGSGIFELQSLSAIQKQNILHGVSELENQFDYMIIDTAPGIDDKVLYFNAAAQEIVLVVTPDPSSVVDSYALIKVLNQRYKENRFSMICNQVRDSQDGLVLYKKMADLVQKFLCVSLDYKGCIPADPFLRKATKSQQLVTKMFPKSVSAFSLQEIAKNISGIGHIPAQKGGIQFFWQQVVGVA